MSENAGKKQNTGFWLPEADVEFWRPPVRLRSGQALLTHSLSPSRRLRRSRPAHFESWARPSMSLAADKRLRVDC